ncbi:MAG: glycosyltransferase [Gemmatimonadetes bacterium]|nr:glycosyltransferase [Gemmatimonadota bacterium]
MPRGIPAPTLDELPPPPPGRTGWPWTEESPRLPPTTPRGAAWPRFSVVTPSFNQGSYLEETIRSVLLQGYPNLEYIVMDGGSSDDSVEILERYAPWLAYWTSRPDRGQSDAINRGFHRSTGDVQAWLNSDDTFYPGALGKGAIEIEASDADILIGAMDKVRIEGEDTVVVSRTSGRNGTPLHWYPIYKENHDIRFHLIQPPMFWRSHVWQTAGELDTDYHYIMDVEWCSRAVHSGAKVIPSDTLLARFLLHPTSKTETVTPSFYFEYARMYKSLVGARGYRAFQCCLAYLRATQIATSRLARSFREQGKPIRSWLLYRKATLIRLMYSVFPDVGYVALEQRPTS